METRLQIIQNNVQGRSQDFSKQNFSDGARINRNIRGVFSEKIFRNCVKGGGVVNVHYPLRYATDNVETSWPEMIVNAYDIQSAVA